MRSHGNGHHSPIEETLAMLSLGAASKALAQSTQSLMQSATGALQTGAPNPAAAAVYNPAAVANWSGAAPASMAEAADRIAAVIGPIP